MKKIVIGYTNFNDSDYIANLISDYFDAKKGYKILLLDITKHLTHRGKIKLSLYNKTNKNNIIFSLFHSITNNINDSKHIIKIFNNEEITKIIRNFNPDITISTHYLVSNLFSYYKDENIMDSDIINVINELSPNKLWFLDDRNQDYYIVSNGIVKKSIIKHGINEDKVFDFGVPKRELFFVDNKEEILRKYSLNNGNPTMLFFLGNSNEQNITFEYFKALTKKKLNINIIFMCGQNKEIKEKALDYVNKVNNKNVLVLGYIKDISNLFNICDIVVTKPGGKILNECIYMKKPSILLPKKEKEEKYNAKFMIKNHYSSKVKTPLGFVRKIKLYLKYPFIVKSMKNKLDNLDSNDSLLKLYNFIMKKDS